MIVNFSFYGHVTQWIEYWSSKPSVAGSSPAVSTKFMQDKVKCPKCNTVHQHIVKNTHDENTNINKIASIHYECVICGNQFNRWLATDQRLKEVYVDQYEFYKNNCLV